MAATDKNGQAFTEGRTVKVISSGKDHPGGVNPKGTYEGVVIGVHEDGPHVLQKDGTRTTPFAADCELL
jgi:hypothetical protein